MQRMDSPEDPQRCQGVKPNEGQCVHKASPDSEYCSMHGGNNGAKKAEAKRISNYRLAKWQAKLERQTESPHIKSLRDEIGILRMLMQETLDRCDTPFDLYTSAHKIGELTMKITAVVEKCHRLEGSMGQLLDKKTIIQMANTFINIISEEELSEAQLDRIAQKILEAVAA